MNATPAASAATMGWMSTANPPGVAAGGPGVRTDRYAATRVEEAAPWHATAASATPSSGTFNRVSYCPAYEASGRSSATADERTANRMSPRGQMASSAEVIRAASAARGRLQAVSVTTRPFGTGKPSAASVARVAALPPSSATGSPPAASSRTTGGHVGGAVPSMRVPALFCLPP